MSGARLRLVLAAAAFLGWIGWLGYAVSQSGRTAVVSRAQIVGATHGVVAEVTVDGEGLPGETATVKESVLGPALPAGSTIAVLNLRSALPAGAKEISPGTYLLFLVGDGKSYRIVGTPASPGYEPAAAARPAIYPWTPETRSQIQSLLK